MAIAPLGFEQTLVRELQGFGLEFTDAQGAPAIAGDGKVEFTAKITEAWKAVAYSRIANRVLMHIADFKAENFHDLEKKAAEIPWELFLPAAPPPTIHVTCKHSRLYHSDAIAERLNNVITQFHMAQSEASSKGEARPHTPPPQNLYVTLINDRCTIWLDLAGEELYKRGHERFVNDAPLKETIAAAMLFEACSLPSPACPLPTSYCLLDLMAGSGTFSLEAAYMANGLIPGKNRDFALKHQPAFKPATWNHIVKQERVILSETPNGVESMNLITRILTSDISPKAVEIIKHNVESGPLADIVPNDASPTITPQLRDFFSYTAKEIADACSCNSNSGEASPVIVLNPPYGKRLDFDAPKLYTQIGRRLAELSRDLTPFGKQLTVAILAPKDDNRPGSKYTCTANLLHECPALAPQQNPVAKSIATSHGGFSLNVFIAKI
ncbi:RNA methyltransferase [Fibrobacter sp. UWB1]|uniref:THUMP domain-containing class I SAM-dependent RNA methyltransferase n=1 Tax=Fibrobacter sp. UWB1 TaxID=1964355 RepID=UPI0020166187|nr:RNA methyltransferase [Fibrobacter sp. UWB1]